MRVQLHVHDQLALSKAGAIFFRLSANVAASLPNFPASIDHSPSATLARSSPHPIAIMAATGDWTSVINDADDETVQLILRLQLDDIKELTASHADGAVPDEKHALDEYKAELQHHQALRAAARGEEPVLEEPPVPVSAVVTFECVACLNRFDADHCYQAPCQHWYCDSDLADLVRTSMTDLTLYPPRCCRQELPFDDTRLFLPAELRDDFAAKKEELDASRGNTGTYCYVQTCSAFIGDGDKSDSVGTCPGCGERTCVLCKHEAHEGDCPADEASRQTEELAQREGWQRCLPCRRLVELNVGCYHMT